MKYFLVLSCIALILTSCGSKIKDGYTDNISYSVGEKISVFLNAEESEERYGLKITDINGNLIKTISTDIAPQKVNTNEPYKNGFQYSETISIATKDFKTGVYLIEDKIPFVIKPNKKCDILIVYSSNTENAYCISGGKSLYDYNSSNNKASSIVSFNRPIDLPFHSTEFLKWINQKKNYSIGYICDKDLDEYNNFQDSKLLIIPGHSEYWSRKARINFDRFIDSGKNALVLSGNTMWFQVRYNDDNNQMICYKDKSKDITENNELKTVIWNDSSLNYPIYSSIGLDFDYGGYGKDEDKGWDGYKIINENSPIFKNTEVKNNQAISLPTDEYDGANLKFSKDSSVVELVNDYNFYKYELIGYDLGSRSSISNGAWIILQKTQQSGIIINTGSTDWCKKDGIYGKDQDILQTVTTNMIDLLISSDKDAAFSSNL